jgi:hypothetical protein
MAGNTMKIHTGQASFHDQDMVSIRPADKEPQCNRPGPISA